MLFSLRNGKCTKQALGINMIGAVPKIVAEYLQLENPETYTGHCLRRTGTSLLVNSGADIDTVKRFGVWKSNAVAEGYIVENLENKRRISSRINNEINKNSKKARAETVTSTEENVSVETVQFHGTENPMVNAANEVDINPIMYPVLQPGVIQPVMTENPASMTNNPSSTTIELENITTNETSRAKTPDNIFSEVSYSLYYNSKKIYQNFQSTIMIFRL